MMKRVVLLLVLGVVLVSGVFGGGTIEVLPVIINKTKKEYSISLNERYGFAYINMGLPVGEKVKYCLLKNGDNYFDLGGELEKPLDKQHVSGAFKNENEKDFIIDDNTSMKWKYKPENCKHYNGEFFMGLGIPSNLILFNKATIKIPVRYGFENTEFELLIIDKNNKWEKFAFTYEIAFFPGEKELYSKQSIQIEYKYFCYAFMKDVFSENDNQNEDPTPMPTGEVTPAPTPSVEPDFLNAAKSAYNDEYIDNRVAGYTINYDDIIDEYSKKTFQENYKRSLNVHFIKKYEEREYNGKIIKVPYFDCGNKELFACMYSENKNMYISTYLNLLFEKNKPVTSQIIKEKLKEINLKYNYNDYEKIPDEGYAFAKTALRYLTWGVEYTPYDSGNTVSAGYSYNTVVNDYFDGIKNWVTNNNANRAGNYRPEEEFSGAKISELEVDPFEKETVNTSPSEIQVIDMDLNTNKIKLIAEMKPDMKMKISNLTIWTSRNSAWDDSKVENITIKGSGDFSHKNILRDKEVGIDADQNIIINNDQEGEKGIKYSFYSDNEEINAFSVIKHFDEEYKSDVIGDSLFTTFVYSRYAYNSDKDKVYKTGELLPRVKQLIEYDPDPAFSQYRDGGGYTGKPGDAGDGKLSTQWEINEGKDVQLRIKFKHLYYVNLIIINWGDDYARSYEINASIDNKVERKAIINVADGNGDVDVNVVSEPVQTNYLTIWCKKPKESGKKYSIKEIRVYAGPDFVEYTVEQENKQLKYIGSGTGLLPGYGLWSSDFTDNNSIGVSHFIFNKSIQCKEIQLIDKTTCGHLRINEVMVFPENPINYSIKNGYNIPLYENIDIKIDNPNNNEGYEWYKNNKKVKEDAKYILINNKPSDYLLLKKRTEEGRENHNWINILFSGMINIRQIVLWENDAAASEHSELYNKGISMYHGPEELGNSIFFTDSQEAQHIKDLFGAESKKITTPFFKILTDEGGQYKDKKVGNPIAYSPMGIDSPRTFNYKMYKQREARIKYIDKMKEQNKDVSSFYPDEGRNGKTTLAIDSNNILNYEFSYVNEAHILNEFIKSIYFDENKIYKDFTIDIGKDLAKLPKIDNDIIKPYLPGVYLTSKKGYYDTEDSPIHIDKVAGVDSIGMVSGILSMLDINTYPEGNPDKGIVNLFNKDMGDEIDTYYKMQAANKKGLDANGKPAFYIYNKNKDGSYLQGEYRLKISDIEKCTVIVPEIKKVQEGDLLVKYDEKGEPHIGIVVAKLWEDTTPSTVEEMMNNILVLSIRKGFRMALLGTWGNGSNMFGGFTETPELYHIRRFVTMKKYTDTYVDDEDWEVVKQYVDTLDCDIFLPPDPYTAGQDLHWIPNTDEILEGIKVNITAKSRNQDVDISDRYNIKLLPPRDYGFENGGIEKNSNKKENIYVNKGSGIIYYALDETDKDENGRPVPYELASFVPRNPTEEGIEWKDLTKDTYYRVNYNSEYFNNDGSGKDDVALKVTNEGYLYFVYKDKDGNIKSTQTFGVKAFGNVRPGDDFLLRFGLVEGDDITVDVKEGDFMACYDKKMLWRANLYVDETKLENGNPSGKEDWNDKNFWIGTPEDPNEWEQEGSAKPGGQVSIQPWLQPGGTFYSWEDIEEGIIKNPWTIAETKIYDAISYSYAGDTLKGFNDKMINQAKNLTKVPPDKWSDYSVSSFVPSYHFYYSQQVKTNYTFYGRLTEDRFNTTIINKFNDMNDRNEVKRNFIKSVYIEMDGIMYLKNLIPNKDKKKSLSDDERMTLEAYLKEINYTSESGQSVRITVKDEDTTTHDAGIVCDQLISQAKKYTNNKYKSSVYTYWEVGTETDDINPDNDNEGHLTGNLNYLVPGDVVHYTGHIGIVKSIEYTDERNTVIDNIKIINSTTWYDTWKVQQRQTVRSFLGEANCTLGRMEEN